MKSKEYDFEYAVVLRVFSCVCVLWGLDESLAFLGACNLSTLGMTFSEPFPADTGSCFNIHTTLYGRYMGVETTLCANWVALMLIPVEF